MAGRSRKQTGETPGAGNNGDGSAGATLSTGASADGTIIIDPANIAGSGGNTDGNGTGDGNASGEPVRKRRGRKPGSRNKPSETPLDINGVEFILHSTHLMLASMFKAPDLALDKDESTQLATAIANVARHYDIAATQKTMDWTALFMALGIVYGPRLVTLSMRRKKKADKTDAEILPTERGGPAFVHRPEQVQ